MVWSFKRVQNCRFENCCEFWSKMTSFILFKMNFWSKTIDFWIKTSNMWIAITNFEPKMRKINKKWSNILIQKFWLKPISFWPKMTILWLRVINFLLTMTKIWLQMICIWRRTTKFRLKITFFLYSYLASLFIGYFFFSSLFPCNWSYCVCSLATTKADNIKLAIFIFQIFLIFFSIVGKTPLI